MPDFWVGFVRGESGSCVDDHLIPQEPRSRNSSGGPSSGWFYWGWSSPVERSVAGAVAGSVEQKLVAGVDQSVEQGLGDDGLGNRGYQSCRDTPNRSATSTTGDAGLDLQDRLIPLLHEAALHQHAPEDLAQTPRAVELSPMS